MLVTGKRYNYDEVDSAPAGSIGLVYYSGERKPEFDFIIKDDGNIIPKNYPHECNYTVKSYFFREYNIEFAYISEQPFVPTLGPIDVKNINKLPVGAILKWTYGSTKMRWVREENCKWLNLQDQDTLYENWKWDQSGEYTVIDLP